MYAHKIAELPKKFLLLCGHYIVMLLLLPGPGHWATRDTDPGKVRPRSLNNNDDHLPHMSTVVQYPHYPHTASINLTSNQHPASRHSMASMGRIPKHGACTEHGATISSIAPSPSDEPYGSVDSVPTCSRFTDSSTEQEVTRCQSVHCSRHLITERTNNERVCGKHSK